MKTVKYNLLVDGKWKLPVGIFAEMPLAETDNYETAMDTFMKLKEQGHCESFIFYIKEVPNNG